MAACLAASPAGTPLSNCQWRQFSGNATAGKGGDLYNYALQNYLITPARRYSVYTQGDRKLGDYVRAFYEGVYVNRQSGQTLAPEPLIIGPGGVTDPGGNLVAISQDNFYNPFGKDFTSAAMRLNGFGNRRDAQEVESFRVVGGLDGTFPDFFGPLKGWSWDASYNFGRIVGTNVHNGSLQASRIAAALGPSMLIGGVPTCVGTAGDPSTAIAAACRSTSSTARAPRPRTRRTTSDSRAPRRASTSSGPSSSTRAAICSSSSPTARRGWPSATSTATSPAGLPTIR